MTTKQTIDINKAYDYFIEYLDEGNSYQESLSGAYLELLEEYTIREATDIMDLMRDTLLD